MQERHSNRKRYFDDQSITTGKYVIPFINSVKNVNSSFSVLEIGCGEGGNLLPFFEAGCERVVGIDLSESKINNAKTFFDKFENSERTEFIAEDIYNMTSEDIGKFDVIITRDVLEHIHDQDRFMDYVKNFMKDDCLFFLGFPPWYNPFGGHQQLCVGKILSKLPYYHILPTPIYKGILKMGGESDVKIEGLLEIKETGITIDRFNKILNRKDYTINKVTHFFINPNYEIKFGLKPRRAWKLISSIPFIRNFFVTCSYYLVSSNNK